MNLDKNQQLLYNYNFNQQKNALCLVAGAGSGKTTTIVHTIVKLINNGYLPEHFFITTFTRSAAKELKQRLGAKLTLEQVNKIIIGTFHEIAGFFLEKYKKSDDLLISSFDDCLYNYANLLDSNLYLENHNYIFIDEYQDINDIQELIIYKLFNRNNLTSEILNKILVVIGDDQQNIYTFRGSNIYNMLNFINKYNGHYIYLTTNYRCPFSVVEMSNNILKYNKNKIDKHFNSIKESKDSKIILLPLKVNEHDIDSYNYLISKMIIKKIFYLFKAGIIDRTGKGETTATLAIISRFNYTLKYLETMLTKFNIKSTYLESINSKLNNRIILSTIHGTKGLEFDHVILIDFIPNKCLSMDELEEERRLFYVAITRTKSELTILYNTYNPSCFLRECWKENNSIFLNLPSDYTKFKLEYNFFKKYNYIQHNIEIICKNLTFDNITELNKICPFRSWITKGNKYTKIIKLHDNIHNNIESIINNSHDNFQPITCYEHLYESIAKNIVIREIYKKYNTVINLDPIQSIILNNYSLIKNTNNIDSVIEHIHQTYGININNLTDLSYLKKYCSYSYKICPKYLDWNNLIDPKNISKFIKSINNFYDIDLYDSSKIYDDILNTCVVTDMTVNNRLSIQYLNIQNTILNKICTQFISHTNKLIDEIDLLNCEIKFNEIITYNNFVGKSDFILIKENNTKLLNILLGTSPDINMFILQLVIAIIYNLDKEDKWKIKLINLYLPFSGQIYRINIASISKDNSILFLNKIININ